MTKKVKFILGGVIILVLVLLAAGWLMWQKGFLGNSDTLLFNKIKDRPDLVKIYNKAQDIKTKIDKTPEEASLYLGLGLAWKSIGELAPDKDFMAKSLAVYEEAALKFGSKNILFYLNAGKLAESIGDFVKAEAYYKKAIEISSADESGYLALADLYSYKMNKTKEEVAKVYEMGMSKMANNIPLVAGRASYLRRVGDYKAALVDYQKLSASFPNNAGFKEVISELTQKLNQK